jgi:hypothetical protein
VHTQHSLVHDSSKTTHPITTYTISSLNLAAEAAALAAPKSKADVEVEVVVVVGVV